jgi:hypothetical protein
MRLSALRLPFLFGGKRFVPSTKLGCKLHRESELYFSAPAIAGADGTQWNNSAYVISSAGRLSGV